MMKKNVCGNCGGPIEADRLAILDTPLCAKCATETPGNILFKPDFMAEVTVKAKAFAVAEGCMSGDEAATISNAFTSGYLAAVAEKYAPAKEKAAQIRRRCLESVILKLEQMSEEQGELY